MQDQKALLDSLMGNDRNAGKKESNRASWRDNAICKHFLVWECPTDFFINESGRTAPKSPFGECSKQHSEAMKQRFQGDKEYKKFKYRLLQDLEQQMRRKIEALDKKVQEEKDSLTMKVEAEKDKLEAAGKLGQEDIVAPDSVASDSGSQAKQKDAPDEICEMCGTYTAWKGAVIMRHEAGLLHVGWTKLRESFRTLEKEVKKARDNLSVAERNEAEEIDPLRITDAPGHKSRDQRRDQRDGRKDADDGKDRDRRDHREGRKDADDGKDRDRRREHDQTRRSDQDHRSRGRERDMYQDRDRDRYEGRRRDADRQRDRKQVDEFGRSSKRSRSRRRVPVDEFGRAKSIQHGYRDKDTRQDKEDDRPGDDDRSQSRDTGKTGSTLLQDTDNCKVLQIEFSEDWEDVMGSSFADLRLEMSLWDMECSDSKDNVLQMDGSAEVNLSVDSFPLKFKFTKKS